MTEPITFPTTRRCPFDPPAALRRLRDEAPVRPLRFPDGHVGWLVSGYAAARAVLSHPGFSRRPERMRSPVEGGPFARPEDRPVVPGFFLTTDPPEHTRYRRLLTGQFTVRRMQLTPRIEQITQSCLDEMEKTDQPADLVTAFAMPIPSLVICELLGVPYEDRETFQRDSAAMINLDNSPQQIMAAVASLGQYLFQLFARKRAEPGDDVISGLIAGGELTDQELMGVSLLLLSAGHETTANMLGLATYALLSHPDQLAALKARPGLIDGAVEELLRYLTIVNIGPSRVALEDIDIEGAHIRAGETVVVSVSAANRDPKRFENPDSLDITRDAGGHLALGHGIHQCLGGQLARIEMRVALPALFDRFPDLRLAESIEDVPMRDRMTVYGVRRLAVAW